MSRRTNCLKRNAVNRSVWMEVVEPRILFADGPEISSVLQDNRGFIEITFNQPLKSTTVNARSVEVFTAGRDGIIGTRDDVLHKSSPSYSSSTDQIFVNADLTANTPYRVLLSSSLITNTSGVHLDGEFNGVDSNGQIMQSGNGTPGGDFQFIATQPNASSPIALFFTEEGNMLVPLSATDTPQTVQNFEDYANEGVWDGTFFNRSVPGFVIQGGGFYPEDIFNPQSNAVPINSEFPNGVPSEAATSLPFTAGSISMVLGSDSNGNTAVNSGTDQWFFNTVDNSADTSSNLEGFTAFGQILTSDTASFATLNSIAGLGTQDLSSINTNDGSVFSQVPIANPNFDVNNPQLSDFAVVNRLAMEDDVTPVLQNVTATVTSRLPTALVGGVNTNDSVVVTLHNLGISPASGVATIDLFASLDTTLDPSDTKIAAIQKPLTLAPNQSVTVRLGLGAIPSSLVKGSYFILPQVIGLTSTPPTPIPSVGQIAVTPAALNISDTVTPTSSSIVTAGQTTTISVDVFNGGNVTAQGMLSIQLSDTLDSTGATGLTSLGPAILKSIKIAPGANQVLTFTVTIPMSQTTGNYYIVAAVDASSFNEPGTPTSTGISGSTLPVVAP